MAATRRSKKRCIGLAHHPRASRPPTAVSLHPENETRLLSIPVADTPEQSRNVLLGLADEAGRSIARLEDYGAVRELVCDLVADGVEATVTATVRETVGAVSRLVVDGASEVMVAALAKALAVDKATALRRSRVATDRGYLKNLEDKPRRPAPPAPTGSQALTRPRKSALQT